MMGDASPHKAQGLKTYRTLAGFLSGFLGV